jgi:transposase
MSSSTRYPPPFRANAVARVQRARPSHRSEWATIQAVATELSINAETLRGWVRQAEIDTGQRAGTTTPERQELLRLRIEHAALRRALANIHPATTPPTTARRRAARPPTQPPTRVASANLDQLRADRPEPGRRLEGAFPDGTDGGHSAHA